MNAFGRSANSQYKTSRDGSEQANEGELEGNEHGAAEHFLCPPVRRSIREAFCDSRCYLTVLIASFSF